MLKFTIRAKSKTRKSTGGVQHGAVQDRAGERGVVPEAEPDPGGAERQAERDRGQARGGQRDDARGDHGAPDQALAGQERSFAGVPIYIAGSNAGMG